MSWHGLANTSHKEPIVDPLPRQTPTRPRIGPDATRVYELTDMAVELRAGGDGDTGPRIEGTAAVYNKWSQDLGGFKERILPGAFTNSMVGSDVRALFNHDPNFVLGRNVANTLSLTDTSKGLRVNISPPDTDTIRDLVLTPMERGDVNQMSFSFRTRNDEWREPKKLGGLWERDLIEAELFDVSVVTFPAYTQTDAAVRALTESGGLNLPALSALLVRAARGLSLTDSDRELIEGSIELLRSYAPEPTTPDEGAGETPDEGAPAPAGRNVVHLRRLLDLRERELGLTA